MYEFYKELIKVDKKHNNCLIKFKIQSQIRSFQNRKKIAIKI